MATIKYIGRTTDFKGKTLWEIVGNLRNFGVGRIVVRSMFERYPEKSFMKILKVEAQPNEVDLVLLLCFLPETDDFIYLQDIRKVKITVEKVFRGRKSPKPVEILSTSYKADYRLIPKEQEKEYCTVDAVHTGNVLPNELDFPPLLREFIIKETGNPNPQLSLKIRKGRENIAKLADANEKPNVEVFLGVGKSDKPTLYKDIL